MTTPLIEFGRPAEGPASSAVPAARVKVPPPPVRQRTTVSVNGVEIPHAAISAEAQQHPPVLPPRRTALPQKHWWFASCF